MEVKARKSIMFSTEKAEYIIVTVARNMVLWMKEFLSELNQIKNTLFNGQPSVS